MIKKLLATALLVLAISGSALPADKYENTDKATAQFKRWEVGIIGAFIFEGHDNDILEDDFPGIGLRAGYRMNENWSGVIEILSIMNADVDLPAVSEVDIIDYIVGVNYDFHLEKLFFTPYISLGLGYRTINDLADRDSPAQDRRRNRRDRFHG